MRNDVLATMHWTGADMEAKWVAAARDVAIVIGEEAAAQDRLGEFNLEACRVLRDRGLLSMLVPGEIGGGGATYAEVCAALATLAGGCPATALTLSMHTHLVAAQVWRHRRDLPAPVLGRVARESAMLISTGAGDWVDSNGTAVKVDGGYRVSAHKSPSSGCPAGDVLVSSARWDDAPEGPQVIHFSVPFGADGVSIIETWDTMGMRATGSHTVVLDGVFVPEGAVSLVRPAGAWHPLWNIIVGAAVPLITAVYVGVAEAAAELALGFAAKRADNGAVATVVGRMTNRVHAAQDACGAMIAMNRDLRFDNTDAHSAAVLSRKTTAGDAVIEAVRLAMEAAGGVGYTRSAGIERLYRDAHGVLYHPLPAAKQELFTGRVLLGRDPVTGA